MAKSPTTRYMPQRYQRQKRSTNNISQRMVALRCQLTFFLFISWHCFPQCLCDIDSPTATSNVTAAFITLVKLQAKYCNPVHLCSLKKNMTGIFGTIQKHMCCTDCSCDVDCIVHHNCCLDYHLLDFLNISDFSNASEFVSELDKLSDVEGLQIHNMPISSTVQGNNKLNSKRECRRITLLPTVESSSILMVSTCQNGFQNNSIVGQCENSSLENNEMIYEITPVTSSNTGVVYKNKFCFICNAKPDDVSVTWDVIVEQQTWTLYHSHLGEILESFSKPTSQVFNIIFQPPRKSTVYSFIQECTTEYTSNCASETDLRVSMACLLFNAPVAKIAGLSKQNTYMNKHVIANFNNAACLSCAYISRRITPYALCTTRDKLQFVSSPSSFDKSSSGYSESNIKAIQSQICDKGYIFDKGKEICRHVKCPLFWHIQFGQCVPMFSRILRGVYIAHLFINIDLETLLGTQLKLFESSIIALTEMLIERHFMSVSPRYELNVWYYPANHKFAKYLVNVRLHTDSVTFLQALTLVANIIHNYEAYAKESLLEIVVSITNTVTSSLKHEVRQFNLLTTEEPLQMRWSNMVHITEGIPLLVLEAHFCYRLMVKLSDHYTQIGKRHFINKATNKLVMQEELQYVPGKGQVADCIDNVIDNAADNMLYVNLDNYTFKVWRQDNKMKTKEIEQGQNDDVKGIWAVVAFVIVVILIIVSSRIRDRYQRHIVT